MLMIISILTYGRLENYRSFAYLQAAFKEYMEQTERQYTNQEAIKRYNDTHATKKEKQEHQSQNQASSTLSFGLFVNKKQRDSNQDKLDTHVIIAKDLMSFLYGDQPFFRELQEKRLNFLDELFTALIQVSEEFEEKRVPKKAKEIATIDLNDQELNDVFTKMLKGTKKKRVKPKHTEDVEFVPRDPLYRLKPPEGYYSLLDFITVQDKKFKIRVYLASGQLLMALFGSPDTVYQILDERYRLYSEVKNGKPATEASEEFKNFFLDYRLPSVPEDMLDFGVSKTNPRYYE